MLVISSSTAGYLRLLDRLPQPVTVHTGNDPAFLAEHAPEADVILAGGFKLDLLRDVFPLARRVRWVHSMWAGVEGSVPRIDREPSRAGAPAEQDDLAVAGIVSHARGLARWRSIGRQLLRPVTRGLGGCRQRIGRQQHGGCDKKFQHGCLLLSSSYPAIPLVGPGRYEYIR